MVIDVSVKTETSANLFDTLMVNEKQSFGWATNPKELYTLQSIASIRSIARLTLTIIRLSTDTVAISSSSGGESEKVNS